MVKSILVGAFEMVTKDLQNEKGSKDQIKATKTLNMREYLEESWRNEEPYFQSVYSKNPRFKKGLQKTHEI